MTLGIHFAITADQRQALENAESDEERIDYIKEVIEEEWNEGFLVESDKAWDAIHRCLGEVPPEVYSLWPLRDEDGSYVSPDVYGEYPLKLCMLGGKQLIKNEEEYFIRLVEPREVVDLVPALNLIDKAEFKHRYFKYCDDVWPEFGEEDCEYSWAYFKEIHNFFMAFAFCGRFFSRQQWSNRNEKRPPSYRFRRAWRRE